MDAEVPDDWSSALSDSWAKVEAAQPVPEPAAATPAAPEPSAPAKVEPATEGRPRGPDGKFLAKSVEAGKGTPAPSPTDPEAQAGADIPPAPPASVSEALKAPQSWTPTEREEFAKAPPAVQKAALRREREIQTALQEAAGGKELKQVLAPYEQLFRQSGLGAPQAVGNLMQTYAALHSGSPEVKAQILAKLVGDFMGKNEASIKLLADALDGTAPAPRPAFDPSQLDTLVERKLAERESARGIRAWQEFEASAPEHLDTVRTEMAVLAGVWERQNPGQLPTPDVFKGFYDRACLINPELAAKHQQEEAARAIATANAATQKAKVVSSSVKTQPGGPPAPPPLGDDTRSHIAAAWDRAASR